MGATLMVFKADLSLSEDFIVTFFFCLSATAGYFYIIPVVTAAVDQHLLAISKQVYSLNAFCHAGVEFQAQSHLIDLSATRNAGLFPPAESLSDSKQRSLLRWRGMFHAKLHYKKRKRGVLQQGESVCSDDRVELNETTVSCAIPTMCRGGGRMTKPDMWLPKRERKNPPIVSVLFRSDSVVLYGRTTCPCLFLWLMSSIMSYRHYFHNSIT